MDILLVCTGNTCRSPMAEGLLKDILIAYGLDDYYVSSAGISTIDGLPASHNAITAAGELGVDISLHSSKKITKADVSSADLILTMTQSQKEYILENMKEAEGKTFTLCEYVDMPDMEIADPFGKDIEEYRLCISDINMLLERLAEKFSEDKVND